MSSLSDLKEIAKLMKDDKDQETASAFLDIVEELEYRLSPSAYKEAIKEIYA